MPVIIRPAAVDDYAAVSVIANEVQELHAAAVPQVFRSGMLALPQDYYVYLLGGMTGAVYIAEQAGIVVGYVVIEAERSHVANGSGRQQIAHIEQIGVTEAARGQGIGSELMATAIGWARAQGADELRLHVWEFNQAAIAFYEHLGLRTQSRTMSLSLDA